MTVTLDRNVEQFISAPRQLTLGGADYLTATVLAGRVYQTA